MSRQRPRAHTMPSEPMHRRKPSISESVSSTSSTSTTTATASHRHSGEVEYDPLSLHPIFHAPPRLSQRPIIHLHEDHQPAQPSFPQHTGHDRSDEPDYFALKLKLLDRPELPRSHWSESTVQTADDDAEDGDDEPTPVPQPERLVRQTRWQNFSHKRDTVPKRPPMKSLDSIEDFIKRGGWKRRGIVFQQAEVAPSQLPAERKSTPAVF